ncbi:MAG: DUF4157 domain-containing protein [Deltaproteobacteria bacterium]|nr:DUF4157 domain-containing protein [Deltaproteobacteria bacterium]
MGFDLEKRVATELSRLADEEAKKPERDADVPRPGKQTRVEKFKRLAAELERRLLDRDADAGAMHVTALPGKQTQIDEIVEGALAALQATVSRAQRTLASVPFQTRSPFDDYRATGLREVLDTLGTASGKRRLQQTTIAAADPAIVSRATRSRATATPDANGRAMWRASERHAATLYRNAMDAGEVATEDPVVAEALARCGSGQPLAAAVRKKMEAELGISLERVRVHTDRVAADAARAVRAEAFTVGEDIFFADSAYAPESRDGQKLIAHELAHVVQAWEGRTRKGGDSLHVSSPGEALEQEAEAIAERIDRRDDRRGEQPTGRTQGKHPERQQAEQATRRAETPLREPRALPQASPAAPAARSSSLLRKAACDQNAAPQGKAGGANAAPGKEPRGTVPTTQVTRDRAVEQATKQSKQSTDRMTGAGAELTKRVDGATKQSLGQLKKGIQAAKANPPGKKAGEAGKLHDKKAQQAKQAAAAKAAKAKAKVSSAKYDGAVPQVDASPSSTGEKGPVKFKKVGDWTPYMPEPLPDQDDRERKRIQKLVEKKVNEDRRESAAILNHFRQAQIKQAGAVRAMAPGLQAKIAGAQSAAIGQVSASESAQSAAVQGHVASVQAQVRAHAAAMKGQITSAHAASLAQIRAATQAANQKLVQAKTQAITDIGTAETAQLAAVAAEFLSAKTRIIAMGAAKAGEAAGLGSSVSLPYDGEKLEAAQKAAKETAAAYASAMPEEASKAAEQLGAEQPKTESDVRKIASDQRTAVNQAFTQAKQAIEQADKQAQQSADQTKTSALAGIDAVASSTSAQLAAHGASQVAAIRQQGAAARAGITQAGAAAKAGVAKAVAAAASGIEKGAQGVVAGARNLETPNPETTRAQVAQGAQELQQGSSQVIGGLKKNADQSAAGLTKQATSAASGMAQTAAAAKQGATAMGQGAQQSMTAAAQGAQQTLTQVAQGHKQTADQVVQGATDGFKQLVQGVRDAYTAATTQLRTGLNGAVTSVGTSFNEAVPTKETADILANAKKAADAVKPWWKKALAFVVSVVVAIVVVVVITALIVTTGPVGAILVGAAAGALGSVAGQMASNLVLGNSLMEGVTWQSVAMGAIGGGVAAGLTAGLSAGAGQLAAGGGRFAASGARITTAMGGGSGLANYGIRLGVNVGSDFVSDAAAQAIVTGKYEFSTQNLITSIGTNAITSTRRFEAVQQSAGGRVRAAVGLPPINVNTGGGGGGGTGGGGAGSSSASGGGGGTPSAGGGGGATPGNSPRPSGGDGGGAAPRQAPGGGDGAGPTPRPAGGDGGQSAGGDGGPTPRPAPAGDQPSGGQQAQGGQQQGGQQQGGQQQGGRPQNDGSAQGDGPQGGRPANDQQGAGDQAGTPRQGGDQQGAQAQGDGPRPQADGPQADGPRPQGDGAQARGDGDQAGGQARNNDQGGQARGNDQGGQARNNDQGGQARGNDDGPAGGDRSGNDQSAGSDRGGNDGNDSQNARGDGDDATPTSAQDAELNDLGYANATKAKGEEAAAAIESGQKPKSDQVRDTEANQQGLRDLEALANDPKLTPEQRAQAQRDLAQRLRGQEEPTGNLARDVAEQRARTEAEAKAQEAARAQQSGAKPADGQTSTTKPADGTTPDGTAPAAGDRAAQANQDPNAPRETANGTPEGPQQGKLPNNGEGLADPGAIDRFAGKMRDIEAQWATMSPDAKAAHLQDTVRAELAAAGLPDVPVKKQALNGNNGEFDPASWQVRMDEGRLANAPPAEVANTLYHEIRHMEQFYRIAQELRMQGMDPATIHQQTGIPDHIIQHAGSDPHLLTPAQRAQAQSYFDSMYTNSAGNRATRQRLYDAGTEVTARNADYERINNDPAASHADKVAAYDRAMQAFRDYEAAMAGYKGLPEEADAYRAGDAAEAAINAGRTPQPAGATPDATVAGNANGNTASPTPPRPPNEPSTAGGDRTPTSSDRTPTSSDRTTTSDGQQSATGDRTTASPETAPKPASDAPRQGSNDLDQLYRDAAVAQQELANITRTIASDLGGRPMIPDKLKGRERAQQKIDADYGGDPGRITDLARSSIEFDSPQQLRAAVEQMRAAGEVVRVKDRFETPADGYRDIMMNVRMSNGHIVEVQMHLKAILDVKNGPGHHLYEQVRTIDATAKTEGRPLTPHETAERARLVQEMTKLYDDAFAAASAGGTAPRQPTDAPPPPPPPTPDSAPRSTQDPAAKPATPEPAPAQSGPGQSGPGKVAQPGDVDASAPQPPKSLAERRQSLAEDPKRTTAEAYSAIDLPDGPNAQWQALRDPNAWVGERQALHTTILERAAVDAQAFADAHAKAQADSGQAHQPEVFAMRGNTASGKTRAVKQGLVPELEAPVQATNDLRHRAVNPDNFKVELYGGDGAGLTSQQVHLESSILADRHSQALTEMKTSTGETGSILIDKRLGEIRDVTNLQKLAGDTGRGFTLVDVDAPLGNSVAGVLGDRVPGGSDPIPPFSAIAEGYVGARANRMGTIQEVVRDPNSKYMLFATNPDGSKVLVAEVKALEGGAMPADPMQRLTILDQTRFEQMIQTKAEAEAEINRLRAQPLTPQTIREITGPMGKYGEGLAKRLEPHMGKTWEQAIADWAQAKPPTPGAPATTTTPSTTPPATGPSATSSSNDSSSMGGGAGFGSGSGKGEPGATPDAPGAAPAQAQTAAATITHETGYTASGAGNDRTTVGVGELVYFSADVNGAWTATAGTASGSGQQFDWTAPARANSSVTITFTPTTGAPVTRTFSVLAPSSVVLAKTSDDVIAAGTQGAGLRATVTFHPLTVSFAATEWKEQGNEAAAGASGYFEGRTLPAHTNFNPNWLGIGDGNTGPSDHASFEGFPSPWAAGSFHWPIIQRYKLRTESGDGAQIQVLNQTCSMEGAPHAGRTTVTKGDATSNPRSPGGGGGGGGAGTGGGYGTGRGGAPGENSDMGRPATTVAAEGTRGTGAQLPHLEKIQASFGRHDVGNVKAHQGDEAAKAADELGAQAYATGDDIAFGSQPDLHTTAHEAAHVVQQRAGVELDGGLDGGASDPYEKHADAVADVVVAGGSAEEMLGGGEGKASGTGSAVVQRKTKVNPVASARHNKAALLGDGTPGNPGLTISDLDTYVGRQADWFSEPSLTQPDRDTVWKVLMLLKEGPHFGVALASLRTAAVAALPAGDLNKLKKYAACFNTATETVQLHTAATTMGRALQLGQAIIDLEAFVPKAVLRVVIPESGLLYLVDRGKLAELKKYYTLFKPTLEAPEEWQHIETLLTETVGKYSALVGWVHDLHIITVPTRQRLIANVADKSRSRPVLLILMSASDWNTAFLQAKNLESSILNPKNLAILVQGPESIAKATSEVNRVADDYGQRTKTWNWLKFAYEYSPGRLGQVVIAGHGSDQSVEMASPGTNPTAQNDNRNVSYDEKGIDSSDPTKNGTQLLIDTVLDRMDPKDANVVFAGCLVGSHDVPPATNLSGGSAAAQKNLQTAIAAHPNLADYVRQRMAAKGVTGEVHAANGSTTFDSFNVDASGKAKLSNPDDPHISGTKLQYVKTGIEPEGALRAAIECYADAAIGPAKTTAEMRTRVAGLAADTGWWQTITRIGFELCLPPPPAEVDIALALDISHRISNWFFAGWAEMIDVQAMANAVKPTEAAKVFAGMLTSSWATNDHLAVGAREGWLQHDAGQAAPFMAALTASSLTRETFQRIAARGILDPKLATLLPVGAPTKGQMILALTIAAKDGAAMPKPVRDFLRAAAGGTATATFPAALNAGAILAPTGELSVLENIGLAPKSAPAPSGGGSVDGNVDANHNNKNETFIAVSPREATVAVPKLNVRVQANDSCAVVATVVAGTVLRVMGETASGWSFVDLSGKTGFVFSKHLT